MKVNAGIAIYIMLLNNGKIREMGVANPYIIIARIICLLIDLTILGSNLGSTRPEFFVAYLQCAKLRAIATVKLIP